MDTSDDTAEINRQLDEEYYEAISEHMFYQLTLDVPNEDFWDAFWAQKSIKK